MRGKDEQAALTKAAAALLDDPAASAPGAASGAGGIGLPFSRAGPVYASELGGLGGGLGGGRRAGVGGNGGGAVAGDAVQLSVWSGLLASAGARSSQPGAAPPLSPAGTVVAAALGLPADAAAEDIQEVVERAARTQADAGAEAAGREAAGAVIRGMPPPTLAVAASEALRGSLQQQEHDRLQQSAQTAATPGVAAGSDGVSGGGGGGGEGSGGGARGREPSMRISPNAGHTPDATMPFITRPRVPSAVWPADYGAVHDFPVVQKAADVQEWSSAWDWAAPPSSATHGSDAYDSGAGDREGPAPLNFPVWWMAPFWSGSGYSSEAINYVLSLTRSKQIRREDLWVGHHGDTYRDKVVEAMALDDREELRSLEANVGTLEQQSPLRPPAARPAVVVCHSLPTNWQLPEPTDGQQDQCPPKAREHGYVYLVGRTMFETDRLPGVFVSRCNAMNEIWVPSQWAVEVFTASGVDPGKLVVVPEGVNTTWFDPELYEPMPMPQGDLVFGEDTGSDNNTRGSDPPFRLLSTFKWEPRKGWDVLLEAYLTEFTADDAIELYIITKPFVGGGDFKLHMHNWLRRAQRRLGLPPDVLSAPGRLPRLYVISSRISDADFPRYYKAADAFVLPSRGEGWGRPHVEAMAMGLPLISTNWSGITAYLDESVGYPIAVERLTTVSDNSVWWFRGLKWAQPSVHHTRQLMRHVYSPDVLARVLARQLRRIDSLIPKLPPPL
ncbi:hypothetical protein GPECTOR_15g326 [Gonium pectorale]|uniref:Glycosyl transferase family 1 domain-containing protein n=1 Tax=Gonium pectorale TaxID=33097 RepID=A0A150GLF6_GONPE|nr:hypothetical protein GPECTOR_15g326 [Gonium pectorale]|eukprot:KXZ50642.1 hypothetical protein GPECTOR_15g326 [Gonium pectorale]